MDVMATANQAMAGRAATAAATDGNKLPPAGKPAPQASGSEMPDIEKVVEQINAYLRDSKREIEFYVDRDSGHTVMRITDASGEVVRQVPSEEVLRIATTLGSGSFHSINNLA
ncbi:MAG: flagellar protein FlaG [Gammaproteobacteria bacterium]|nr:flagellar protein FlaG [Gammaproteobacteria bacterium]